MESAIAFARKRATVNGSIHPAVEEWLNEVSANSRKYSEPVNRLVRSARCLLTFAEDILRSEVRIAIIHEDAPRPGEQYEEILDRLLATELGATGIVAQRLRDHSEDRADAGTHRATRRAQAVEAALHGAASAFVDGFNKSDAEVAEADLPIVAEAFRKLLALAATVPGLDAQDGSGGTKKRRHQAKR